MKLYPGKAVYYTCSRPWFNKFSLVLAVTQIQFMDMQLHVFWNCSQYICCLNMLFGGFLCRDHPYLAVSTALHLEVSFLTLTGRPQAHLMLFQTLAEQSHKILLDCYLTSRRSNYRQCSRWCSPNSILGGIHCILFLILLKA